MLQINSHQFPASLDEAYDILQNTPNSVILGGCGYLRLGDRRIDTAIDLSRLDLDAISQTDSAIRLGAMATLRSLEINPVAATPFNGVLPKAVGDIVGIQLRNCVTIGGSVAGRYPFSDPVCALLALDAEIELHHSGRIPLTEFLKAKPVKDILTSILLPKLNDRRKAAFTSIRRTRTDYAVLNVTVSQCDDEYRIAVGSRPGRALLAPDAANYLTEHGLDENTAAVAGSVAARELQFGDNPRGSSRYRQEICPVLVKRALIEVMHAS